MIAVGHRETVTRGNITWDREVVSLLDADTALVRLEFAPDDHIYARELVEGDTLASLCRCEHRHENSAVGCVEAKRKLADVHAERARQRIAARPAPDGARFLFHCNGYWSATLGGACPTCGVVGEPLVPTAEISNKSRGFTSIRTNVGAHYALEDLGVTPSVARLLHDDSATVDDRAGLTSRAIIETLRAKGWSAATEKRARRSA